LDLPAWRRTWQMLRRRHLAPSAVTPAEVGAWHRREAADCEKEGQWPAAIFHLSCLIDSRAGRWMLRDRRAQALLQLQQWAGALGDLREVILHEPQDPELGYRLALCQLASNEDR